MTTSPPPSRTNDTTSDDIDNSLIGVLWRDVDGTSVTVPGKPLALFGTHLAMKALQTGGSIGTASTLWHLGYRGYRGRKLLGSVTRTSSKASLVFLAVNFMGATMKVRGEDRDDGIEDRAFRIYHNRGQNRVDRFSVMSVMPVGVLTVGMIGLTPHSVLGGAALGAFCGVLAHAATIPKNEEEDNK